MTEADHVTPACHVSRRKWGGKWPHCEYFLLSLPTRAGGAATLRITPTQYMNININIFSTYIKSVLLKVGVCYLSVIQSKYLSETTKAWLPPEVSISPTSCLPFGCSLASGGLCYLCHLLVKRNKTIGCVNLPHSTLIHYSV